MFNDTESNVLEINEGSNYFPLWYTHHTLCIFKYIFKSVSQCIYKYKKWQCKWITSTVSRCDWPRERRGRVGRGRGSEWGRVTEINFDLRLSVRILMSCREEGGNESHSRSSSKVCLSVTVVILYKKNVCLIFCSRLKATLFRTNTDYKTTNQSSVIAKNINAV